MDRCHLYKFILLRTPASPVFGISYAKVIISLIFFSLKSESKFSRQAKDNKILIAYGQFESFIVHSKTWCV